jgi:hypothetical protein
MKFGEEKHQNGAHLFAAFTENILSNTIQQRICAG